MKEPNKSRVNSTELTLSQATSNPNKMIFHFVKCNGLLSELKAKSNPNMFMISDKGLFESQCKQLEQQIANECIDETGMCEPIIDGIIDIEGYLSAPLRILWILKEPYDDEDNGKPAGGGWHLSTLIAPQGFNKRMGRSHKSWHPIIYTSYGILNNFQDWEEMDYIGDTPSMTEIVRSIAIINVKKLPGLSRTRSFTPIQQAFDMHRDLLLRQLEVYSPDVIIGGSTLPLFYVDLELNPGMGVKHGSIQYFSNVEKLFINAYHPAQTSVPTKTYVDDIVNLVKLWSQSGDKKC